MRRSMRFVSDNAAPAHPKVIEAIVASNRLDTAYDGDEWSERLDGVFSDLFETEVRALWVSTGTAANCLALAALCPPYRGIICHRDAHIEVDEAGRSEEHTSELQSHVNLVCRLLLEKKKQKQVSIS